MVPPGWGSGITTSGNIYSHLFTLQDLAIHDAHTTPATSYPADNGSTFYVVVTDTAGSLQSSTATLTVNPSGGGGGSLATKTYGKGGHGQSSR